MITSTCGLRQMRLVWLALLILAPGSQSMGVRLLNVRLNERISHLLLESKADFTQAPQDPTSESFLNYCWDGKYPRPFPQFVCPLIALISGIQPPNQNYTETVKAVLDRSNHFCANDESCVVLFLPYDRVLVGCADVTDDTMPFKDFIFEFFVPHNVSNSVPCEYDVNGRATCSADSTFVDGYILQEEHSCCCPSTYCGVLIYDQPKVVAPFVRMTIDLVALQASRSRRALPGFDETDRVTSSTSDVIIIPLIFIFFIALILSYCLSHTTDDDDGLELEAYGYDPASFPGSDTRTLSILPPTPIRSPKQPEQ